MKKIFITSLILLIVILFFLGVYNFAYKKNASKIVEVNTQNNQQLFKASTSIATSKKIAPLLNEQIIGPALDKKNESILFYGKDGSAWKIDTDGKNKQLISDAKLNGLKNVSWSPDLTKALTSFDKNEQVKFYEYDSKTQKAILLKEGLDTAVWDNLGTKIFYKYYDGKERTLNIANPDGSNWQKLADINFRNLIISPIPSTSLVAFWNAPTAGEESQLTIIGATGGQSQAIFKGRYGADYLWSPDGSKAIVSSLNDKNGKRVTLGFVTQQGNYTELNIPTFASKCVWSQDSKTVYFALPGGIPDNSILPDDYLNNKFYSEDTFWKIDLTSGKQDRIIEANLIDGKYDSANLFLSPTEDALFFINKRDQKLYKLSF